ncbi:MAG: ATP-dependent sacrificial sulfur transferase LarE [Lamprobacter sp.]|uniref:ATP-dependent sacrificial sulfur transferase LarE n=1 Tax=Lamprobacter sp. TaxID=3100796 RepID=UPI002B25AC15|nr:ATP-dependent sacrificial sulfur transferase LarE [Lamprobacter sp.]MEA3641341.1 ATP-dependent sacrificial sulfur transferase LarE [Lamprobacter sp.]
MEYGHGALIEQVAALGTAAVAFSGGADSTLMLALLRKHLGREQVIAFTAVTPYMMRQEIGDAVALADKLDVRHELVEMTMPEGMDVNPTDRCYRCKRAMYRQLMQSAAEYGFSTLIDGSNRDDADEQRPGLRALRELGIRSPFIELGIDKAAVRQLAREMDLPTWYKPTNACLLTRIGFNVRFTMDQLQRIEEAERFLLDLGYTWVRVRCHGELARIEVAPVQRERLLTDAGRVIEGIQRFGFRYVTMDLAGYQAGSMND